MDPATGSEWIPAGPDAALLRAIVFLLIVGAGALTGWTLVDLVRRNRARAASAARSALGVHERPDWAPGEWACGRCKTVNRPAARHCARCRGRRDEVELHFEPVPREPDIIPPALAPGPVALVMLAHDPAAHGRSLSGHWLLKIDGVVVGSAATRSGAATLLRCLRDVPVVMADPKGEGYAHHPTDVLAAAFDSPGPLPFSGSCPEQTRR